MSYEGGDYQPTAFGYLYQGEQENDADTPGGLILAYNAAATLLIGDVVFISAAFAVNKNNTPASYQKFAGVVVGGFRTDYRVLQDDGAVGLQAALVNEVVLVGYLGKFKVIADAAIAAAGQLTQGATTAGRVDDSASATQGQIIGIALEAAANAGDKILALINHR